MTPLLLSEAVAAAVRAAYPETTWLDCSVQPQGSWQDDAVYVSPVALRMGSMGGQPRQAAHEIAVRLRGTPGVARVEVQANGFLSMTVTDPGDLVKEIVTRGPRAGAKGVGTGIWPDFPRTFDNPGFAIRFAHARAAAVRRQAAEMGLLRGPYQGSFDDPLERALLRVLAEWHSRVAIREAGLPGFLERLACAYHDVHERCAALPKGDEPVTERHRSRLWLAEATRVVLSWGLDMLGEPAPDRI